MELKGNEAERWGQIYNTLKELNERIEDNLQKLNKLNEESAAICESIATDKATIEQLVDTAKKGQFAARSNNLNDDDQTKQTSIYFEQFISILNATKTEEENSGDEKVDTELKHSDVCSDKPEENIQEQQAPLSEPEQQKGSTANNETESTDAVEETDKEAEEPQQEASKKSKKAKHSSEMSEKQQTFGFDTGTETEKRDE